MLVINTCPGKETGAVAGILNPFLDGLKDAGAEVELFYGSDLLIFPCCGNLNCTVRTPGQCMAYDDMRWLRPKIGQADVLVLASPLYFNGLRGEAGVTESVKLLQEQLAKASDLSGEPYEHAVHTTREQVKLRKVVIVTSCGFWEIDDFYPVLTHLKALCYNSFPELSGCIAGPARLTVHRVLQEGASEREIAATARAEGREFALAFERLPGHAPQLACNSKAKTSDRQREWDGEMLYKF